MKSFIHFSKRLSLTCAALIVSNAVLSGCGNWNTSHRVTTGEAIKSDDGNYVDNNTGDIISTVKDGDGNEIDCLRRNVSGKSQLPLCNSVVGQLKKESQENQAVLREESQALLNNKLSGSKLFTLPNGSKIRILTRLNYNDQRGLLKINATVERVDSTKQVFENLFIDSGSKIQIDFLDSDDFAMLEPLVLPLNVAIGQRKNINYTKKFGSTTDDITGMMLQARVPLTDEREYREIARLQVAFKP